MPSETKTVHKSIKDLKESDNKAVILNKAKDLKIGTWPIDKELGPDDVLLESKSNGICGTDIHLWKKGFAADFAVKEPMVLGHEPSALVIDVGSNVKNLKIGDRVAVEPMIPCWKCEFCRSGRYNLCPTSFQQSRGLPPMNGCLRKYYTHPSECCFKFPETLSWEEGAMVEPFAIVVHACRRVGLQCGHNVMICGAGPIGIMALLCAKAFGATKVCITDIDPSKLELAKTNGADQTFLVDTKNFVDTEFAKKLQKDFGHPPDITIECTGVESSISMAIYATKIGGKICTVGLGPVKVSIPMSTATIREIKLIGSSRIKDDYQLAIDLIVSKKVNLKPLVTHRFPIEKALEAFDLMKSNTKGVVKVIIEH